MDSHIDFKCRYCNYITQNKEEIESHLKDFHFDICNNPDLIQNSKTQQQTCTSNFKMFLKPKLKF